MAALLVYRNAVGLSLDAEDAATPEQSQRRRDAFASKLAPTAAASAGTTCAWAATNGWPRLGLEAAHIKWFQTPKRSCSLTTAPA
jgi:hypothetical protein